MNAKNGLQEYCQKHKWTLPCYLTTKDQNSLAHDPIWNSKVIISTGLENKVYYGTVKGRKNEAEISAAETALNELCPTSEVIKEVNIIKPTDIKNLCKDSKIVYFIDLESLPQMAALDWANLKQQGSTYIGIVSDYHPLTKTKNSHLPIIPVKGEADYMISFLTGNIVNMFHKPPTIVIVTNDYYGEIILQCLAHYNVQGYHLTNINDFYLLNQ